MVRVNLKVADLWQDYNEALTLRLGLKQGYAQVYQGTEHAVKEVGHGLARLFPHRKKVYFFKNLDPSYSEMVMDLATNGYELVPLSVTHFQDLTWMDQLDKETLMVVYPVDDPMFAQLNITESFRESLTEKKVFQLSVSHHWHRYTEMPKELNKYEACICSLTSNRAMALLGERAKLKAQVAPSLTWDLTEVEGLPLSTLSLESDTVKSFEDQWTGKGVALLKDKNRVYDRAVLSWSDLDGYALIDQLAKLLNRDLLEPGEEQNLETSSLSRWGGLRTMAWLLEYGYSKDQVRGTVVISRDIMNDKLVSLIPQAVENVYRMQSGQ